MLITVNEDLFQRTYLDIPVHITAAVTHT